MTPVSMQQVQEGAAGQQVNDKMQKLPAMLQLCISVSKYQCEQVVVLGHDVA